MKESPMVPNNVIFKNEPRLSPHEVDAGFNESRMALLPHIKEFISTNPRFQGKEIAVTFMHHGVSSVVAVLETTDKKLVLKIPLSKTHSSGEALFLRKWEEVGVKVPHIIEDGTIDEHPYLLMEYIDAPVVPALSEAERNERNIYAEMGATLRQMHTPEAHGYGRLIGDHAEFATFEEWLKGDDMQEKIAYVEEHQLLTEAHGRLETALDILTNHTKKRGHSSYCHDDFGIGNIFATKPITVFDPNPRFQDDYMDLARGAILLIANGEVPEATQLIQGYFKNEPHDEKVLQAAMALNTYTKFPYWHKKKRVQRMESVTTYLAKTKDRLGT